MANIQPIRLKPENNARGISEHHAFGINRLVKLKIFIEGRKIAFFKHFKLRQSTSKHHYFELILAHDTLGEAENHNLENTHHFLGKRITILQSYKDVKDSPERTFVGVITKVGYLQEQGNLGNILLSGYSPTILLDAAPHTQSFGGTQPVNMSIIASDILRQGIDNDKYDLRVDANDYCEIPYSAQYNETHYNYLARMAEAYGEQFFYDGEILHFGKLPHPNQPIRLSYGSNISDIHVELKAVHTRPEFYGYNSSLNAKLTAGPTPISHVSNLAQIAFKNNEKIFKTRSLQVAPIKAQTDKDVVYSQQSSAGSQGVEVFTVSGNTSIPFLHPGCVCDIEMRKPNSHQTSYFTRVMITESSHDVDMLGHYQGTFKAIASDTGFLPKPEFTIPTTEPQLATVISNTDPKGQGRVQVRFDWQLHDTTDWIRVMTPDAGSSGKVSKNRGFMAIPEVGDQVMIGFQHNHPDRPFVMGGMFHGKVGAGGGINNHMRSIQTKSGIKILMNDDEKSITIKDPSGNTWYMDGQGNIEVTAPETITLNSKNMNINVSENMNTNVGMNATESIGMVKSLSTGLGNFLNVGANFMVNVVGKMVEMIQGDKESQIEQDRVKMSSGKIMTQSQGENEFHSEKEVQNNSSEQSKTF
ncbi:type VI secretion system Vgr family protein [Bergeyella zoohelcum]|uniref:Uncharacterized protein conserved in bacteria n=1 Tax=Bergeyella zoohelcum TaxID=1015 RepID=A0A380ZTM9_9FLAO|nr:phage baseplate assembly protein V [Bergeyella zoohelcum]EKB59903.1 hypothetical protein HMPREF9700_01409 [Bergeyella zoohelcum CCUG 30536]SUV52722.1 Uncharacterized protein conserved in bacteria [Bergeyella zoohelcum]